MDASPEAGPGGYKQVFGALFQLTKLVNSGVPLPELLRAVSVSAAELTSAQACSVMLLDEGRDELLSKAAHGLSPEEELEIHFELGQGVAGWVAEHGAPALIPDVAQDPRFVKVDSQTTPIHSMLCVPLSAQAGVIGTLTVTSNRPAAFTPEHQELLLYLGSSIVKDIENARLYRLSITDGLTKAYNRQYLYQRLPEEIDRARRYGDPLSLVLLDIDYFKAFNDRHGRLAGDFVLKELVRLIGATVRDVDGVVRLGGAELLLLLPKTPLAGALHIAERLRVAVSAAALPWSNTNLQITISLGVAQLQDGAQADDALLQRAADALERAKRNGRNRVVS